MKIFILLGFLFCIPFVIPWIKSFRKSYRLSKLQKRIRPEFVGIEQLLSNDDEAFSQFIDLCESDHSVKKVMEKYGVNRKGLEDIFNNLEIGGAGQWVKGHYVALSSFCYAEPLEFYLWSKKEGKVSDRELACMLVLYFSKPPGGLYRIMTGQRTPL